MNICKALVRRDVLSRCSLRTPQFQARFISDSAKRRHRRLQSVSVGPAGTAQHAVLKNVPRSTHGGKTIVGDTRKNGFRLMPLLVVSGFISVPTTYYIYMWMSDSNFRTNLSQSNPRMYDFMLANVQIANNLKIRVIRKQVAELEKRAREQGLLDTPVVETIKVEPQM